MIAAQRIASTLAAERLLETRNPDLLRWTSRQWDAWLARQRDMSARDCGSRLLVGAAVSGLKDLSVQVGVMQLLAMPDLRCGLVLHLPTNQAVRLLRSQARRGEWESLVHICTTEQFEHMLGTLEEDLPTVAFECPTSLGPEALKTIRRLCHDEQGDEPGSDDFTAPTFIGRAAHHGAWRQRLPSLDEWFHTAFRSMLELSPEDLKRDNAPPAPPATPERVTGWKGTLLAPATIEIAALDPTDELVIAVLPAEQDPVAFVRRAGSLPQPLEIRPPARLLTTSPQKLRLEVRRSNEERARTDLRIHVPPSQLKSWMVAAFLNRGGAGNPVIRAFAEGLGCRLAYADDEPELLQDIPVVWGVLRGSDRILAQAKAQDLYYYYIDHAYFHRGHGKTYRIARNGYEAGAIRRCPPDRWNALGLSIQPWRKEGREIIVCPPTEFFMQAHGCPDWLQTTLASLEALTDRPIIVREKPKAGEDIIPLEKMLETAHALVTHSSNVAIEAVCLGTPVFVAPSSAAASIGQVDLRDIERPVYADREPWLAHLAYNQFSFDEIRSGAAWKMLLELEGRDHV